MKMLNKVSKRVYYMDYVESGDRPILGLVVGDKYSLVIDGGNSESHAEEFLQEAKKLMVPPIKYLVLTHHHWDHVFGAKTINAINIVQRETNKKLMAMKTLKWTDEDIKNRVENNEETLFFEENIKIEYPNNNREIQIPMADIVFENRIGINLGGVSVEIENIETDHGKDNVLVNIKDEKVVFLGDALCYDAHSGPLSISKKKLYPLLEKLNLYHADYYIPAHSDKFNKKDFNQYSDYIKEICEIVGESKSLEESIENYKRVKGKIPSEEDKEEMSAFVFGNIKL